MKVHRWVRTVGSDTYLGHWRGTPSHQHNWKQNTLLTYTNDSLIIHTYILINQLYEHISNLHLHIFNEEYNIEFQILQLYIFCVLKVLIFSVCSRYLYFLCAQGTYILCVLKVLIFSVCSRYLRGPGSSVGIATDCGLGGPGIESRWGRDFSHTPRPALGPT
jgi:hypothetical protein